MVTEEMFDSDADLMALLPWYLNGTLSADEQAAVAALLERSAPAREELAFLNEIAAEVRAEPEATVSELGWRRLQRDLQATAHVVTTVPAKRAWWKPGLAAAATVIIALQVGILVRNPADHTDTRLLGQRSVEQEDSAWLVQVEFADVSEWRALADLLAGIDARLVDGPSALGIVRLAVDRENERFASAAELVNWLQQQPLVVHAALEGE